jgi:hypothetical protein
MPDPSHTSRPVRKERVGISFDLIAYGFLMAGTSAAAARFAPQFTSLCYFTGIGGFCLGIILGMLELLGHRFPNMAALALSLMVFPALWLNIQAWRLLDAEQSRLRLAFAVTLLMVVISAGQLILYLIHNRRIRLTEEPTA